jgi:hypothetical protein
MTFAWLRRRTERIKEEIVEEVRPGICSTPNLTGLDGLIAGV